MLNLQNYLISVRFSNIFKGREGPSIQPILFIRSKIWVIYQLVYMYVSRMKIQKHTACFLCHQMSLNDCNFLNIVRIHTKLYIFGELSIWNCWIRCLNCVLEFYKKVKKRFVNFNMSFSGQKFQKKIHKTQISFY